MKIPEKEIERVKAEINLASVIRSRGVELKKKGRQLWGLCPFHSDSEPSFAVDERKDLWNCLGTCQTGGDAFSFVMKADSIGFAAAFALFDAETRRRGEKINRKSENKNRSGNHRRGRDDESGNRISGESNGVLSQVFVEK